MSDCLVLKEGCLRFQKQFHDTTEIDPWNQMTFAGSCMITRMPGVFSTRDATFQPNAVQAALALCSGSRLY